MPVVAGHVEVHISMKEVWLDGIVTVCRFCLHTLFEIQHRVIGVGGDLSEPDLPSVGVDAPSADVEVLSGDVDAPSVDVSIPSVGVDVPLADVGVPSIDVDVQSVAADLPAAADVSVPKLGVDTPSATLEPLEVLGELVKTAARKCWRQRRRVMNGIRAICQTTSG